VEKIGALQLTAFIKTKHHNPSRAQLIKKPMGGEAQREGKYGRRPVYKPKRKANAELKIVFKHGRGDLIGSSPWDDHSLSDDGGERNGNHVNSDGGKPNGAKNSSKENVGKSATRESKNTEPR